MLPRDRGHGRAHHRSDRSARSRRQRTTWCKPGVSRRIGTNAMTTMRARSATFDRRTTETQVRGRLILDGRGRYEIATGIRFFDHMLELFTRHGAFDLSLHATGDLDVDQHHTVEDVGITLGEATLAALGKDRKSTRLNSS